MFLCLMSPFTSIKDVASDKLSVLSWFLKDRFRNIDIINKVNDPILIIHGKKDELISYKHSEKLIKKAKNNKSKAVYFEEMTHNKLNCY